MRAYLTDWAILAQSPERTKSHGSSGLSREPGQVRPHAKPNFPILGHGVHHRGMVREPSTDRMERLHSTIRALLVHTHTSARQLAQVLRAMEARVPLVPLAGVHSRPVQKEFSSRWSHTDWEAPIPLRDWFGRTTRTWLSDGSLCRGVPITLPLPVAELYTDASHLGWGAHALGHHAHGTWDATTATTHINSLELRAVSLALRALAPQLPVGHVRVRSDNATTIA